MRQLTKSLAARHNDLADTFIQLEVLNGRHTSAVTFDGFAGKLANLGYAPLRPETIRIFQINVGKLCNQTCAHCHVDAGPDRKVENMSRTTFEQCLTVLAENPSLTTVDITGGAPEMNPNFKWFVSECRKLGKHVINRCNLTIITANKKYNDLPQFFAENNIEIVSSLPHYSANRTDSQRGDGVFDASIKALQMLNEVGYGQPASGLALNLVYNPTGAFLPGNQASLEAEFKRQLLRKYQIVFNNLYAITNMPISRFLDYLLESDNYENYMQALLDAFNPATIEGLMCRNTISVSWDGYLHDCDFNQMLDLKVATSGQHISTFDMSALATRPIVLNQHCYGCTAGSGSSCGGEVV